MARRSVIITVLGVGMMLLLEKDQTSDSVTFTDVAVHDPSIIKVDIFGSHIEQQNLLI